MNRKGFSLIELMLTVAVIILLTCAAIFLIARTIGGSVSDTLSETFDNTVEQAYVRAEAAKFLSELGVEHEAMGCVGQDSNYDGYVTCTVVTKGKFLVIECGCRPGHTGCRLSESQISFNKP